MLAQQTTELLHRLKLRAMADALDEQRRTPDAVSLDFEDRLEHWHECVGDATSGDAILDRLVHHAHRITLAGWSLRKLGANTADAPPIPEQH